MARRARSQSDHPPAVTQDALVAAALVVLNRDGLDGLSMRRVAAELGVQAASLYWHVAHKEELLDLLADALLIGLDLDVPADADWREQTRVMAHAYRDHLKSRRDAARVISGRFIIGTNAAALMDRALGVFRAGGFAPDEAAAALHLVYVAHVQGFVVQEIEPMRAVEALGDTPADAMDVVTAELDELGPDRFPHLAEVAGYLTTINLDARFTWGLDCILDGLEHRLTQRAGSPDQ